jgi:(S)-2-hydroxy-acid oxidase
MCAEDAILALKAGADAIYVSNHGARQLDTTPCTIEVLPEIVAAVKGQIPVWCDGGIRNGRDALKALALGADFVWMGRPALWALACQGQKGVERMIEIVNEELTEAMKQCGCQTIQDIREKNILYSENELLFAKM